MLIKLLIAVKAKEDQQVSSASTNCPAQDHTWQLVVTQSKLVGSVDTHKLNLLPSFRSQSSPSCTSTTMFTPDIFNVDLEAQLKSTLTRLCHAHGVPHSGRKAQLLKRLRDYRDRLTPQPPATPATHGPATDPSSW